MVTDVFISHSSRDKQAADAVCHALEQGGIRCWIAPRDVRAGFSYGAEILSAIRDCRAFLLLYSRHSGGSDHVKNEIERAFGHEKIIIPYRMDDSPMDDEMEYFLSRRHWIDAYPDDTRFDALVQAVRRALEAVEGASGAASPPVQAREEPVVQPQPEKETPPPKPPEVRDVPQPAPAAAPPMGAQHTFQDAALEQAVRKTLKAPAHLPLSAAMLASLQLLRVCGDAVGTECVQYRLQPFDVMMVTPLTGQGPMRATKRGDIQRLADIPLLRDLKSLTLVFQRFTDLSPLAGTGIGALDLSCNDQLTDLSPLRAMPQLANLSLQSIAPAALPSLWAAPNQRIYKLELSDAAELADISGISALEGLQYLYIARTGIADLSPLKGLAQLKSVTLTDIPCWDYTPLAELNALESVLCFNPAQAAVIREQFGGAPPFDVK